MKRAGALVIVGTAIAVAGCGPRIATLYVRPSDGAAMRCDASGFGPGIWGAIAAMEAGRMRDNCIRDALALGMQPVGGVVPAGLAPAVVVASPPPIEPDMTKVPARDRRTCGTCDMPMALPESTRLTDFKPLVGTWLGAVRVESGPSSRRTIEWSIDEHGTLKTRDLNSPTRAQSSLQLDDGAAKLYGGDVTWTIYLHEGTPRVLKVEGVFRGTPAWGEMIEVRP